jgi:hypothetical protein
MGVLLNVDLDAVMSQNSKRRSLRQKYVDGAQKAQGYSENAYRHRSAPAE